MTNSPMSSTGTLSEAAFRLLVESVEAYAIFMLDPENQPGGDATFVVSLPNP
jgi:hypothetical protein